VADLKGVRFVASSETKRGSRIDTNLVKSLTGDDTINARHIFQRAMEFKLTWSILLATNHRPEMPGDDMALWERVKLIPFDVRISDEQKDTNLKEAKMAPLYRRKSPETNGGPANSVPPMKPLSFPY
jgi:putative DNA primase/helicase